MKPWIPLFASPPAYRIDEIPTGDGPWAKANGVSPGGEAIVGQRQPPPVAARRVTTVAISNDPRTRAYSYFDRDNGYTNRAMIDPIALAYLLANPRLIREFYRRAGEKKPANLPWWAEPTWQADSAKPDSPPRPAGEPFLCLRGRLVTLPSLAPAGTPDMGQAFAVNRAGWVAGQGPYSALDDRQHALLWLPVGGKTKAVDLGLAARGTGDSAALALNDKGVVVGETHVDREIIHAFAWEVRGNPDSPQVIARDLGTLGGAQSRAVAVNKDGRIAGWAENGRYDVRACLWQQDGKVSELPAPDEAKAAYAIALNDAGYAAGFAARADGTTFPLLWDRDGKATALSCPASCGAATALNNRLQIVGSTGKPGTGDERAALWENGAATDLNTAIPALTDWKLVTATGITDSGQIVGWGWRKEKLRAFRLTPPTDRR